MGGHRDMGPHSGGDSTVREEIWGNTGTWDHRHTEGWGAAQ